MYVTGSDAWNSQKQMSEGQNRGPKARREVRQGLPDGARRGNQWRGLFCGSETRDFRPHRPEPFAYSAPAPIFGS